MSQVTVLYRVTDAVVRAQMIASGHAESRDRKLVIDLTAIEPGLRKQIVDLARSWNSPDNYQINLIRVDFGDDFSVDHDLSIDEIPAITAKVSEARKATLEAKAERDAQAKMAHEAAMAERARRDELARQWREAEDEKRREDEQDKRNWVSEFGSEHLRRAVEAGYDSQRQYVIERAASELPGFTVDFNGNAEWKSRSYPSEAALNLADDAKGHGFDAVVVWLTSPALAAIDERIDPEFEPCEAVIAREFLGKYDLVRVI